MPTKNTPIRKLVKYLKAPIKILAQARDFYVNSLTGCAGNVAYYGHAGNVAYYGHAMGCPNPLGYASDRNYDTRELVRAASARTLTESEILRSRKSPAAVTRSRTVGIGRIDEDKPSEFWENDVGERAVVFPRTRSYAAAYSDRSKLRMGNN